MEHAREPERHMGYKNGTICVFWGKVRKNQIQGLELAR